MVIKTISLRLHEPSRRKRALLDDAMERYTIAFAHLIERLRSALDGLDMRQGAKAALRVLVDKELLNELNEYGAQPFKDALLMDAGMTLAVYRSHKRAADGPLIRLDNESFDAKCAELFAHAENHTQLMHGYGALLAKHNATRPILFCRHDPKRDYCLLHDPQTGRFYAKLYLLNSEQARKLDTTKMDETGSVCRRRSALHYVGKNGSQPLGGERHPRYILVPLEFGEWQQDYLRMALRDPSMLRTAQLVKKGNAFFLNVRIAVRVDASPSEGYVGVCRALQGLLHITAVDEEGNKRESDWIEQADWPADNKVHSSHLHRLANEVVSRAARLNSRIVLYSLGDKTDGCKWNGRRAQLTKGDYNAFTALVRYKAECAGLQPPVFVSPVGVFDTCPLCGKRSRSNRMNDLLTLCTNCGHICGVDELGSLNLAHRLIRYQQSKVPFFIERNDNCVRFYNATLGFDLRMEPAVPIFDHFHNSLQAFVLEQAVCETFPRPKRAMLAKLLASEGTQGDITLDQSLLHAVRFIEV